MGTTTTTQVVLENRPLNECSSSSSSKYSTLPRRVKGVCFINFSRHSIIVDRAHGTGLIILTQNNSQTVAHFYRAMLCICGTSHSPVSVCLSIRPSQAAVLLKWQNIGSHKTSHMLTNAWYTKVKTCHKCC